MPKRKADEALATGKSKAAKKGSAKRGAKRGWNTPVFRVTRLCRILAVTGVVNTQVADSGGYQSTFALNPTLADIPDSAQWYDVFDQFRIAKIEYTIYPRFDTLNPGLTAHPGELTIGWYIDTNSDTVVATTNENPWLEQEGYTQRILETDKPIKITVYPKVNVMTWRTSSTTGYGVLPGRQLWLDTNGGSALQHFGLKLRVYSPFALSAIADESLSMYAKYYLEFKDVK